jgi:hypothetical protein
MDRTEQFSAQKDGIPDRKQTIKTEEIVAQQDKHEVDEVAAFIAAKRDNTPSQPANENESVEPYMAELYEIDMTFKAKLDTLGMRSRHRMQVKHLCEHKPGTLDWGGTSTRLEHIRALAVYIQFTNRNLVHLK